MNITSAAGETHQVTNVAKPLENYNLYTGDTALQEAVERYGAAGREAEISEHGEKLGSAGFLQQAQLANHNPPELDTHDRYGNRVDLVRYHPAYHQLMEAAISAGLHASPWDDDGAAPQVTRAAKYILQSEVEAGHGCPITMTFACIPSIRLQPELAAVWESKILSREYDPRNLPITEKRGVTIGMGMTEKQGGSDVRANSTQATPVDKAGPGELYELVGHKWFLSAPMCDAFLVLAYVDSRLSCFLVPRWKSDGTKNPVEIVRLKNKMGNRSNASSEVEFRGAEGWLINEEGRGVPTIIEMVSLTRFDCMLGSTGLMRASLVEALHHCQHREAFGKKLIDQPLMRNVLADMALEYEAALAFSMDMARCLDEREANPAAGQLARLALAVGKYWICKRTPQLTYEAMECIGGSGVMEDSPLPRYYREAVINPIWEGSGNVQCLDVLRALGRNGESLDLFMAELELARGRDQRFDVHLDALKAEFTDLDNLEFRARSIVEKMAVSYQASLLLRHAPEAVAASWCESRLDSPGHHYGRLSDLDAVDMLIDRAMPAA